MVLAAAQRLSLRLGTVGVLLFILTGIQPVWADSPDHIQLELLNDSFTLGVTDNPDDMRSFGMKLSLGFPSGWEARAKLSGLTNRFGYDAPRGRLDELVLSFGYAVPFGENPRAVLMPRTGLVVTGNIGCAWMQNTLHRIVGYDPIDPPYDRDGALRSYVLAGITLKGEYQYSLPWYDRTQAVLALTGDIELSPGYSRRLYGGASIGHRTDNLSYLMLGIGYRWSESLDGMPTTDAVSAVESGVEASLESRFGLFLASFQWNLESFLGYGRLGIDFGGKQTHRWDGNDLMFSMGLRIPFEGVWTHYRYRLSPGWGIRISNAFNTQHGETRFAGQVPADDDREIRRIEKIWLAGADYELTEISSFAVPFASVSLGIRHLHYTEFGDPDEGKQRKYSDVFMTIDGSLGIRLSNPDVFQWKQTVYGAETALGVQYTPGGEGEIKREGIQVKTPQTLIPYISFGITIDLTL